MKTFFYSVLACLAFAPGIRGQYRWRITHPATDSGYTYHFNSVDCAGEVCTAVGVKEVPGKQQGTLRYNMMCFRSTDGGASWKEQDPGMPHNEFGNAAQLLQIQQLDSLNAVVAGDSGHFVRTTDGGNSWIRNDLPVPYKLGSVHFSDPMTGIATVWAGDSNIITTNDGGVHWKVSPWYPWLSAIMCHSDGGEKFRAIRYENGPVYFTSDSWQEVDSTSIIFPIGMSSADSGDFWGCVFRGLDTIIGYGEHFTVVNGVDVSHSYPLILTSIDNGMHWNYLTIPQDSDMNYVGCMSPLDRDIVFAGGYGNDRHILVSIDHGMSWNVDTFAYSSDTDYPEINALAVTGDNHGVAIADIPGSASSTVLMLGEPVSMDVRTSRITNSNLQIYPNPASQAISLESQEAGKPVEILDVLGQEVLSGRVPASGRLTLDISSLPAGLYYVSDGHSRTKFVKE